MAENVGSIRYTTEVDTSDTLTAEKQIDKATTNIANDFKKVDVAAKKTQTQMTKTSKAVKTGLSGMGRNAGQAGIQFQQFIGQVQGGQNAMLALSQQSADLGFVLGAPLVGAIVGISASLLGIFLPTLFDSGKGVDELIEKMNEWKKTIGLTKEQAAFLINEEVKANTIRAKSIAEYTKEIDIIKTAIENQKLALSTFNLTEKARKRMTEASRKSNDELEKAEALRQAETQLIVESGKKIDVLNGSIEKGTEETKKQKDAVSSLKLTLESQLISLEQQAIALRDGEEAAFRWATAQRLGMKDGELFEQDVDRRITALFKLKKAQEETKVEEAAKKKAESFATGIVKRGLSPEEKLAAEEKQLIRDKELISLEQFEAAKTSIEKRQSDLRKKQRDDEAKAAASAQQMMTGAVLGFVSATTGALMAGMDEQSGAYKALFAIQKATAIASTIIAAETAAATALAPPPLGLGPVAGIGLSNLVRGLGYASAGIIAGTAIAGGRQFGGPVNGGSAYRVGEAGPEIFSSGGKNFMIPGENGKVIANDDIGGGGFTQNVEIVNNTPSNVTTQTSNDGKNMRIFINEVANQINNNQGAIPKALRSSTNTTFKANS